MYNLCLVKDSCPACEGAQTKPTGQLWQVLASCATTLYTCRWYMGSLCKYRGRCSMLLHMHMLQRVADRWVGAMQCQISHGASGI
jgi:hypothetical protein